MLLVARQSAAIGRDRGAAALMEAVAEDTDTEVGRLG
jgi:hypothetical protein